MLTCSLLVVYAIETWRQIESCSLLVAKCASQNRWPCNKKANLCKTSLIPLLVATSSVCLVCLFGCLTIYLFVTTSWLWEFGLEVKEKQKGRKRSLLEAWMRLIDRLRWKNEQPNWDGSFEISFASKPFKLFVCVCLYWFVSQNMVIFD